MIYDLSKLDGTMSARIMMMPKYTKWFSEAPDKLLGIDTNAKTIKGVKYNIETAILYLSPGTKSGCNLCPMSRIAMCEEPCLDEAGRGAMGTVQMSRLRKTLYLLQYPELFYAQLKREIEKHCIHAVKKGFIPAIRLNGTSDWRWENYIWDFMVESSTTYGAKFYDYTKIVNRVIPDTDVYDLTFSYSGVEAYQPFVLKALSKRLRMAVVFRDRESIPSEFMGMECIDGDDSDVRFIEPHGVVVALYAKGKAKKDTSGFVVN
jgi:hypothetical protein